MISTKEKSHLLTRIDTIRFYIDSKLRNGFIKEEDLEYIFRKNSNYGITNLEGITPKEKLLKEIFNDPFLILDQDMLSPKIKNKLFIFLNKRYSIEINELEYLALNGYISKDEFLDRKGILKFCYYDTSDEGRSIKEPKKVKVK